MYTYGAVIAGGRLRQLRSTAMSGISTRRDDDDVVVAQSLITFGQDDTTVNDFVSGEAAMGNRV